MSSTASPVAAVAIILALAALGAGCESTQDKSRRIGTLGSNAFQQKGLVVKRTTDRVSLLWTRVLQDHNGVAVVVAMKNKTDRLLTQVPVSISVRGPGESVFRNDEPGLEPSLVKVPLLRPREQFVWVNDQVDAGGRVKSARARIGEPTGPSPKALPPIELTQPRLEQDPVSGVAATGFVSNGSRVDQRRLVVFAVARRGSKIVAAGRGQINRVQPQKRARYNVFFIGNPRGAKISVSAPPTVLP